MDLKYCLREKILAERKLFDEYKFHSENELIIDNVNTIINVLCKDLMVEEKNTVKLKTHDLEIFNSKNAIGLYLPIKGEPDLTKIMLYNNKIFGLPKIDDKQIKFVHYQVGAKLEKKAKGILEPTSDVSLSPSIIIVPALAYSQKGHRIGFGCGHYDRYFSQQIDLGNRSIIKIGVCFDKYLLESLPNESHDIKFDYIVTDKIILKL